MDGRKRSLKQINQPCRGSVVGLIRSWSIGGGPWQGKHGKRDGRKVVGERAGIGGLDASLSVQPNAVAMLAPNELRGGRFISASNVVMDLDGLLRMSAFWLTAGSTPGARHETTSQNVNWKRYLGKSRSRSVEQSRLRSRIGEDQGL